MKILFANSRDIIGGAAIAAYRLHKGMRQNNYDSTMLVDIKTSNDPSVISAEKKWEKKAQKIRSRLDYLPQRIFKSKNISGRSLSYIPGPNLNKINNSDADIVHLHWINNGFLSIEQLAKINKPLVWTLHDMWPFCGAEHYVGNNEQYKTEYEDSTSLIDRWVWQRKKNAYSKIQDLTIVTPSNWLATCVKESSLLKDRTIKVIANGIDTDFFKPAVSKYKLRIKYRIPVDKKIILFSGYKGAEDKRKGFHHLLKALKKITGAIKKNTELLIIGSDEFDLENQVTFKYNSLGMIDDMKIMRDLYALSDLFVLPSKEDNLPNTVLESMACGTPVVAFNIGGVPDMVEHERNGYLAEPFNENELANGIEWCLIDGNRLDQLSDSARKKVQDDFEINTQIKKYYELYNSILNKNEE